MQIKGYYNEISVYKISFGIILHQTVTMTGKSNKTGRQYFGKRIYIVIKTANVDLFICKYLQIFRLTL